MAEHESKKGNFIEKDGIVYFKKEKREVNV